MGIKISKNSNQIKSDNLSIGHDVEGEYATK